VVRWNSKRQNVRWRENVARAEHEHGRFHLRFWRKRNMHGHLVAVEVRVERGANERVNTDSFAFDEGRLKRLDAKTVQRGSAIQEHGVLANHVFKNVPHHGILLLDHFLGLLDGRAVSLRFELVIDERLEKLKRHLLWQTPLVELELGADHDDGTAGVVHALAEQVLAKTALLALERIGQGLEGTIVGSAENAPTAAIVEQGVDSFLQHALFVAHDDVRRAQFHQLL